MFVLKDKKWRDMRNILTPVFTGSKLRGLVQLISNCGEKTVNHLVEELKEKNTKLLKIDIMDTTTRFTNDVIATSAFGIEVNSIKDPKNDFFMAGREIIRFPMWRFFMMFFLPAVSKILDIRLAPRYVYDFLFNIINETIRVREEKNIVRPDMVHLLIEARKEQKKVIQQKQAQNEDVSVLTKNLLTNEDIVAQGFIFFFAGYGNVAVILSFAAYELAVHPEIQKRLQDEISHVLNENNGQLDYDAIKKMKYLDMVLSETLRKWPPLPIIDRECTKAYQIKSDDLTIDLAPGMGVQIPIAGFHYDPKYYPNPEKFDPERFSDENKANMNPYVYMPFGLGPRVCVAVRFVMIETKIFLIHLLRQFDVVVTEKTPIPMVLKSGNVIRPKDDFNLALVSRNE
uniref:Cytochrome P450 CYP9GN2 n=1 Tax=Chrysoperla zastrowi sillemi TaxID=482137 RepID=A0A9E7Y7A7_9NEOP|nr:cytochrome P450 CYP9GN2 [Chrysoperla zastrowi sillemi]